MGWATLKQSSTHNDITSGFSKASFYKGFQCNRKHSHSQQCLKKHNDHKKTAQSKTVLKSLAGGAKGWYKVLETRRTLKD